MFNISQLNEVQVLMFALILLRMSSFVVSAAIFSSQSIAVPVKILFSLVFTIAVFQPIATNEALVRLHGLEDQLLLLAAREVAIGVILGFVTRLFFFAISMAGEMVSISMGLGQAQIFNPMMGSMGNAMEQFYTVIATLVFLALNGHHIMLQGLMESFTASPVAQMTFHMGAFAEIVLRIQNFFVIGIKIAAPIMISMMIVQFGVALLSRVVPQINVIMTQASITAMIGFVVLFISLPLLVMQMAGLMDFSMTEFFKFLRTI